MALNLGYMQVMSSRGQVVIRIYYDATVSPDQPQPLINGPRGFCLDVTNTSGRTRRMLYSLGGGELQDVTIPQGDPVNSRSKTAAQMNQAGYSLRTDISGLTLE